MTLLIITLLAWALTTSYLAFRFDNKTQQNFFILNAMQRAGVKASGAENFARHYVNVLKETPNTVKSPVESVVNSMRKALSLPTPPHWNENLGELEEAYVAAMRQFEQHLKDSH